MLENRSHSVRSFRQKSPVRYNDTYRSNFEIGYEGNLSSRRDPFNQPKED